MRLMGFLEADHQRAQFRQPEPFRHLLTQYAPLPPRTALAGDDEHKSQAVAAGVLQERLQRAMRPALGHAMQIETGVNLLAAARQLRALAPTQRHERRRL